MSKRRAKYKKQRAGRLGLVVFWSASSLAGRLARAQLSMCCVSGKFSLEESCLHLFKTSQSEI